MLEPLLAAVVLDRYFLEARAKLLDVAAILDRIERGGGMKADARMENLQRAFDSLQKPGSDRAERLQELFSLKYEAAWERPRVGGRAGTYK